MLKPFAIQLSEEDKALLKRKAYRAEMSMSALIRYWIQTVHVEKSASQKLEESLA